MTRLKNSAYRSRKYLIIDEVIKVIVAAMTTGYEVNRQRNELIVLMLFLNGLRLNECRQLLKSDVDLIESTMTIKRLKAGQTQSKRLHPREVELLKVLIDQGGSSQYVFESTENQGELLSEDTFHYIVKTCGVQAGLPFSISPHMLRHSAAVFLLDSTDDNGAGFRLIDVTYLLGHGSPISAESYSHLLANRREMIDRTMHQGIEPALKETKYIKPLKLLFNTEITFVRSIFVKNKLVDSMAQE